MFEKTHLNGTSPLLVHVLQSSPHSVLAQGLLPHEGVHRCIEHAYRNQYWDGQFFPASCDASGCFLCVATVRYLLRALSFAAVCGRSRLPCSDSDAIRTDRDEQPHPVLATNALGCVAQHSIGAAHCAYNMDPKCQRGQIETH
eukprot:5776692-Amphidinium_carterae.1